MEHVSHFNQKMAVHTGNEALMCKVFPSSLGPVAMRWFDALEEGSIRSFVELIKAFGARFITCSRVPKPVDSLLSMCERRYPRPLFFWMLGQTHVNEWSRVIVSQNRG